MSCGSSRKNAVGADRRGGHCPQHAALDWTEAFKRLSNNLLWCCVPANSKDDAVRLLSKRARIHQWNEWRRIHDDVIKVIAQLIEKMGHQVREHEFIGIDLSTCRRWQDCKAGGLIDLYCLPEWRMTGGDFHEAKFSAWA